MRLEDVKVGMKVVPHSKSVWNTLDESEVWKKAKSIRQPYLYVCGFDYACYDCQRGVVLKVDTDESYGDFFLASDFEPYVEKQDSTKIFTYELQPYAYTWVVKEKDNVLGVYSDTANGESMKIIFKDSTTIVILQDGCKGIAKLKSGDQYNAETGFKIAYQRACKQRIENKIKELTK